MKKFFLMMSVLVCGCVGFAADSGERMFNTFATNAHASMRLSVPSTKMRKNYSTRTITFDIQVPQPSSAMANFDASKFKKQMTQSIKGSPDARYMKQEGISMVIRIITTDRKVYRVVISGRDF